MRDTQVSRLSFLAEDMRRPSVAELRMMLSRAFQAQAAFLPRRRKPTRDRRMPA